MFSEGPLNMSDGIKVACICRLPPIATGSAGTVIFTGITRARPHEIIVSATSGIFSSSLSRTVRSGQFFYNHDIV